MDLNPNEYLNRFKTTKKGVPRNEREYWLQETATLIRRPVKQVIGLTSHFPDWTWTRDLYLEAVHGKNPPALWWYLYKKTKI